MRTWFGFIGALIAAIVLAIMATTPPAPRSADAPLGAFSAGRAMADVRQIAAEPHPAGSAQAAIVHSLLMARLQAIGLETSMAQFPATVLATERLNTWSERNEPPATLTNIVAVLPGTDRSSPAVLLMAHHDSVWASQGAPDDATGVASAIEIVRALRNGPPLRRDVMVLLTDAEELGLVGAHEFFDHDPRRAHVGAIINMESRGGGGRTTLFETSRDNGAAARVYAGAVHKPAASSLGVFIYKTLPNSTDLTAALKTGPYTAYNFAFIGRPGLYHSPLASPERLDQGSLQDMGGQVLDLTRALGSAAQLPAKAPDVVFFDVFGLFTALYAAWLGWLVLGASAVLYGVAAARGASAREVAGGAGRMLTLIVGSGVLLYLLNLVSGPQVGNYYDRLAAIPKLEVMALLGCFAAAAVVFGGVRLGPGTRAGAAIPLLLLALALQIAAPTAAYVVEVPLLLGGLGAAALAHARGPAGTIVAAVTAALVLGYQISLAHQLMQGVGPAIPSVAALPLALGVLVLVPLWPVQPQRILHIAAGTALALALATALYVRFDPVSPYAAHFNRFKPSA